MTELTGGLQQEHLVNEVIRSMKPINQASNIQGLMTDSKLAYKIATPNWWHNASNSRFFFLANEHDNIHNFFKVVDSLSQAARPMTIVNFDEHIDDSCYSDADVVNGRGLNASWQRHAVDTGRTDKGHSYNIYPNKTIYPASKFTQEMTMTQFEQELEKLLKIDVLSIDLDFFNRLQPQSKRWTYAMDILKKLVKKSSSTMLFTSPVFSKHLQSIEIAKTLFEEVLSQPA